MQAKFTKDVRLIYTFINSNYIFVARRLFKDIEFYLVVQKYSILSKHQRNIENICGGYIIYVNGEHSIIIFIINIVRGFVIPITPENYTELLYQNEAKKRSRTNEMIHRDWFGKNVSRVSYIYIANSKIVLVLKKEYVLRIFQKLSKNKIQFLFVKLCIKNKFKRIKEASMKIDGTYKVSGRFYKIIKLKNYQTCLEFPNNTYINGNNKKIAANLIELNIINYMTIERKTTGNYFSVYEISKVLHYIFNVRQHVNLSRIKKIYFQIEPIIKRSSIESFLKINIKKIFVNNMKYQCREKNNCAITANRFVNIGPRDCIEKKILRQTRQASHMRNTCSNKKKSNQYKPSKKKRSTKNIEKGEFCAEKNPTINVKSEKMDKIDSTITSQVDTSHINTMSLFYEVVDTKSHITNNYEITDNYLKQNIKQKPTLIVKFKKIRQSELSLLNGEAENFMFPKRFSYDKQSSIKYERTPLKRSFSNAFETATECKVNNFDRNVRHSDYSSVYNNGRSTNNSTGDTGSTCKISDNNYSFEKIPSDETWFNVFRRQDESKEKTFEYYGSTGFRKLPYEMGPLPAMQNYHSCSLQEPPDHTSSKKKPPTEEISIAKQSSSKKNEHDSKNFTQIHENSNSGYRNFEMPRISPREHASTLAILSCLIKKSNDEVDLMSTNGEVTQNENIYSNSHILKLIENVKSLRKKTNKLHKNEKKNADVNKNSSNNNSRNLEKYVNMKKLTNDLDYFLVTSFSENTEHLTLNQNINHFSNDMNLLEITENQYNQESLNKALCINKYKAKRKNNKTGWPKKKKIVTRQQKTKATDNKSKNSEFLKRMSPITPPYSDSEESIQCSYLNVLDNNFQHSYFNGIDAVHVCNNIAKKPDDTNDCYTKDIKYTLDKTTESEKHIEYSLQPNIKFNYSPRKLRKLRGRYRER